MSDIIKNPVPGIIDKTINESGFRLWKIKAGKCFSNFIFFGIIPLLLILIFYNNLNSQTLAFPGADGFGKFAAGGRGGKVFEVTNLNDEGQGSLRYAIEQKGPRTIVFNISGTIKLKKELNIENGDLTIAGQTAPGDGVCIRDYKVHLSAENVIIRYLRFRLGDETKQESDCFDGTNSKNVIIDHCSFSWSIDELGSFYNNVDFTLQWCLLAESLDSSYHHKGKHGFGAIWGGKRATFHHNLIAHNSSRNPRFQGARKTKNPDDELVDFRNNCIFNWGFNSAYGGEMGRQNVVANYYKSGPASLIKNRIVDPWDSLGRWYVAGNYVEGYPAITSNNWAGGVQCKFSLACLKQVSPFEFAINKTQTAEEAYEDILKFAGANLPKRDPVDKRIINEVRTGIPTYEGFSYRMAHPEISSINKCGIIDSQKDVGGWPELKSKHAKSDHDHDGIPDEWEIKHGLNPKDSDDGKILTENGYTNLEEYLNQIK
jgi:hypothetical protein